MTKEDVKLKVETLLSEISFKAPLNHNERIDIALLMVNMILGENPRRIYWDTHDDETPSAITVWNGVKTELETQMNIDSVKIEDTKSDPLSVNVRYVPCLPCPFCGCEAFLNKKDASWSVVCPICVTVARIGVTKDIAIERWNNRRDT